MKTRTIACLLLSPFIIAPHFAFGYSDYSVVTLSPSGGDHLTNPAQLRFDDGSYENGINWYSDKVGAYVGWAKKLSLTIPSGQFMRIDNIVLAFSRKQGDLSADCDYDLAVCADNDGQPDVENPIWQASYTHSPDIPTAPDWSNVDHIPQEEVLLPSEQDETIFWVCYFPRWTSGITPDPPFYFCLDTDSWYVRSYGNSNRENPLWQTLPDLSIMMAEFACGVDYTFVTGVQPFSLGELKTLYR